MTMTFTVLDASNSARVTVCHTLQHNSTDVDVITLSDLPAIVQAIRMAQRKPGWSDPRDLWVTVALPAHTRSTQIDAMHRKLSHFFRAIGARRHPFTALTVKTMGW